jgi:HEAT repeat protein
MRRRARSLPFSRAPRARAVIAAALLAALVAPAAALHAQSIARRVAAVPDGVVWLAYPTRSGVCGDGRDVVALGGTLYVYPNVETHGRWSGVRCEHGDAHVALTVRGGAVDAVRVRVGAGAGSAGGGVTNDLGTVPAADAADYLLGLAARVSHRAARQALLGAVVADGAEVAPGLLRIARDRDLDRETRRTAIGWLGEVGDASTVGALEAMITGDEQRDLGGSAMYALSRLPDDVGIPSLIAFARSSAPTELRKDAVFWLGQSDARRARETVRAVVQDTDAPDDLRAHAVFALGHGDAATADDLAFLRRLFPSLASKQMRDQVLMAVARNDGESGRRWALERARDGSLDVETRKQALFWAEQGGASTAELIATYDGIRERELREHALFVLSRRDEPAARDKLLAIARGDEDRGLRKTALFWLTQKRDPRAARLIEELIGK